MKKYLTDIGYSYTEANDLRDKQFTLLNVSYAKSDSTVMKNYVFDRTETYSLFLVNFDAETFGNKIELAIENAISDGVGVFDENTIEVENVENGYNIVLQFNIIKEG